MDARALLSSSTSRAVELGLSPDLSVVSRSDLESMLRELSALRPVSVRPDVGLAVPDVLVGDVSPIVIDTETTGVDPTRDRIVAVAAIVEDQRFVQLCNPGIPIPESATAVHRIRNEDVVDAEQFERAFAKIEILIGRDSHVWPLAYKAPFDRSMVAAELERAGLSHSASHYAGLEWIDPLVIINSVDKFEKGKTLVQACKRRGIQLEQAHSALCDAEATMALWRRLLEENPAIARMRLPQFLELQKQRRQEQEEEFRKFREGKP
jgi:DNA polymerase III subunit epsilon